MSTSGRVNESQRRTPAAAPSAPAAAAPVKPAAATSGSQAAAAPASPDQSTFSAARPPVSQAGTGAEGAVAAREASRKKYADYDRLLKDGRLDVAIGVGYDETGADHAAWNDIQRNLTNQGFKLDRVTDQGVHVYTQKVQMQGKDIDVTVNAFQGRSTKDPLAKFTEAMSQNELVIYTGHARYGSGPDFNDVNDNSQNYGIGRGYTSDHKPTNLYEMGDHRGIKGTDASKDYQIMLMFGCKTKDYEPEIRSLLKGTKNLDLVTTQDIAYWNDLPKGVDIFLKGLKAGQSNDEIISTMNEQIKGENPGNPLFKYKGGEDNTFQPGQAIPTIASVTDVLSGKAVIAASKDYNPLAERAQKFLMKAGIVLGKNNFAESDGVFGAKTTEAVKAFQVREKLPETGIIDSATMRKLESYSEFA